MITLSHVQKIFGTQTAVSDVSFSVKPGEIVGLLGPNGAGKTTTIRMMAGVLPPTHGSVMIDNKNFLEHEYELKREIGYLPENNPLYDEMTVEEHLNYWGEIKGLTAKELVEAKEFAARKTGITEVYYRMIGELSKGYRQRVGLAQAILARPRILLLDEPTEGLDPNQRKDIQRLLEELREDRTVIVSSHVLSEISKLASRIIIVSKGRVVGDDSVKALTKKTAKEQLVEVEIEGKNVLTMLKKIDGVSKVTKGDGAGTYILTADGKVDIRPIVFKLAEKQKWTMLSMKESERGLEEVFSELTQ